MIKAQECSAQIVPVRQKRCRDTGGAFLHHLSLGKALRMGFCVPVHVIAPHLSDTHPRVARAGPSRTKQSRPSADDHELPITCLMSTFLFR